MKDEINGRPRVLPLHIFRIRKLIGDLFEHARRVTMWAPRTEGGRSRGNVNLMGVWTCSRCTAPHAQERLRIELLIELSFPPSLCRRSGIRRCYQYRWVEPERIRDPLQTVWKFLAPHLHQPTHFAILVKPADNRLDVLLK